MNSPYPIFKQEVRAPAVPPECVNVRYGQAFSSFGLLTGAGVSRNSELQIICQQSLIAGKPTGIVVRYELEPSAAHSAGECMPAFVPQRLNLGDAVIPGVLVFDDEETELGLTEADWAALGEQIGRAKAEEGPPGAAAELEPTPAATSDVPVISLSQLSFSGNPMRRDRNGRFR